MVEIISAKSFQTCFPTSAVNFPISTAIEPRLLPCFAKKSKNCFNRSFAFSSPLLSASVILFPAFLPDPLDIAFRVLFSPSEKVLPNFVKAFLVSLEVTQSLILATIGLAAFVRGSLIADNKTGI